MPAKADIASEVFRSISLCFFAFPERVEGQVGGTLERSNNIGLEALGHEASKQCLSGQTPNRN